jgi:KDO2-lipid IV(A) lauroyltransferase
MAKQRIPEELFTPKHWPAWILVGFLWLITRLPYRVQIHVGVLLGHVLYHLARDRRRVTEVNLRLCFPELDEEALQKLLKKTIVSNSIGLVETAMAWWIDPKKLDHLIHIEGLEHWRSAIGKQRGVILIGAHFTTLDLAGSLLSLFIDVDPMYRKSGNPVFEWVITSNRSKRFKNLIERSDIRRVLKTLKEGRTLWYAPDQNYAAKHSVFAPFFGIEAATITATTRFAQLNQSPLLIFSHVRREDGSGYTLKISPPIENFPTGDERTDATRINYLLAEEIRQQPDQYMWVHRRFKTRPEGEPPLYQKKKKHLRPDEQSWFQKLFKKRER